MPSLIDCTQTNLPVVTANYCAPDVSFGQVKDLYLGYPSSPFTDVSSLVEWTSRLSNSVLADLTKIRQLFVIGSKPAAESNEIEFSQGRKIQTPLKHSVPFKVDETDVDNYAFMQFVEANPNRVYAAWYTAGKYLFGGDTGVYVNISLKHVIPESDEELQYFEGVATWDGVSPDRILNPMA